MKIYTTIKFTAESVDERILINGQYFQNYGKNTRILFPFCDSRCSLAFAVAWQYADSQFIGL